MTDKARLVIQKGLKAKGLLEGLSDFIDELKAKYVDEWTTAKTPEARELIWHKRQSLEDIEHQLTLAVSNGTLAERKLREENG